MKKILLIICSIVCIPHILLYLLNIALGSGIIKKDLSVWKIKKNKVENNLLSLVRFLLLYPEFRSVFYFRLGIISRILCFYLPPRTNLYFVTKSANIGGGLYVGHGWGTVINAKKIGENFTIAQNCTIGSRNGKIAEIGDNVSVWAHSVVLGGIKIGNNTQIGAGSVVVKDVPSNAIVVPAKSEIIRLNGERVNILL